MKKTLVFVTMLLMANTALAQKISIRWDASEESDFSHYNIYRSEAFDGPFEMLEATTKTIATSWTALPGSTEPTTRTAKTVTYTKGKHTVASYTDTHVEYGVVYWYQVRGVDKSWNESEPSNKSGTVVYEAVKPKRPTGLISG